MMGHLADLLTSEQAVQPRHFEVKHNQVGPHSRGEVHRLQPIRSKQYALVNRLEFRSKNAADHGIVVCNNDADDSG